MMNVAWIGLGQMGLPTARQIAAAGHPVRAYDINPPAAEDGEGLILCGSPSEAAKDCDLLAIAVFSDAQVEEVLTGPAGVLSHLKPGAVVAIFTTGTVQSVQALAAAAPAGISVLDTCFSRKPGGVPAMLTLLVGGEEDATERCRPVFDAFSDRIFHIGPSGSGRKIKLVNNILFASHLQIAADAMGLAEGLGLDRLKTAAALTECSGSSGVLHQFTAANWAETMAMQHRYMVKDVALAAEAAQTAKVDLGTLGAVVATYLKS